MTQPSCFQARYGYARVVFSGTDPRNLPVEVIAGVEMRFEPPVVIYDAVRTGLGLEVWEAITRGDNDGEIAAYVEKRIRQLWPGRSYFLEVGRGALQEWVQVFEPKAHTA